MYFESDTVKSDCPVQIFRKMMKYLKIFSGDTKKSSENDQSTFFIPPPPYPSRL